jgi:outer membrane protein insertion porin family
MMCSREVAIALMLASNAFAQRPLVEIKVSGNERLAAAAVIAASGLHKGQTVTHAELDAAAHRLADTGFFTSVNYSYDPKTTGGGAGYAVALQVSEEPSSAPVELDIPGQDTDTLWQQLKSADGLIDRQMPNNDRASAYYKRVIEEVLRKSNQPEEIVLKTEADLRTGRQTIVCRPAHLSRIAAIRFEGNAAIGDAALQAAMTKVALGQEYSERDFRRMLELNLRPLYEEAGRLTVAFRSVKIAGAGDAAVTVTAGIQEGPEWRLGQVAITGESLPLAEMHDAARFAYGAPANWKLFMATLGKMEQVLRSDGYLREFSKPVRAFHESTQVVDVNVVIKKGAQFRFGELHIEGLDAENQQRLAGLWKLPAGAPMNELYTTDFLRSVLPSLKGKFKTVGSELHVRKDSNVADVTLKFR